MTDLFGHNKDDKIGNRLGRMNESISRKRQFGTKLELFKYCCVLYLEEWMPRRAAESYLEDDSTLVSN
jgi:hypothetical protein